MDVVDGRVLVYSTAGFVPRLLRTIRVPGEAVGSSLTRDGRLLLIAGGQGATVVSVARAERGAPHPVLGSRTPRPNASLRAAGAIETASSADGRYVFVSLEYGPAGGAIAVYRIGSSGSPEFGPRDYVGAITLGEAVVGSALSPDGRALYVTSELAHVPRSGAQPPGTLSVIDVSAAERALPGAVRATVSALQQPVRVAVTPSGQVVWVTARASNRLIAFSAAKLLSDPRHAMVANVPVGTAPVGVATFDHGNRVLVADSDRFQTPGAHPALTVVDARAALGHRSAVHATLHAGGFPREIAIEANGRVGLISDFGSRQLEVVRLAAGR